MVQGGIRCVPQVPTTTLEHTPLNTLVNHKQDVRTNKRRTIIMPLYIFSLLSLCLIFYNETV